ncbi:site-specific integrase [Myxococcota bacterium]|nr:site-specific integrase [Myxococcota bacterium]
MPLKRLLHEVTAVVEPVMYTARGITRYAVDLSFVTDEGEPIRLQRRGFPTRGEAILWAEREVVLVKTGAKRKTATATTKAAAVTTEDALGQIVSFWRSSGRKKESTLHADRCSINKHVLHVLGDVPWSRITQAQIDRLVADAQAMPTPRHLTVLKAAFRDSRRAGLDPPAVLVDIPRRPAANKTDFINATELDRICAHTLPRWAAAFQLLFHTGLRGGELMALEWGDLDFGHMRETMTVRRTVYPIKGAFAVSSPKSGKHRTVPLNVSAVRALTEIATITHPGRGVYVAAGAPLSERLVFPADSGGYMNKSLLARALSEACRKAGVRHISPHTLRHSFGSNLVQAGVDLYIVCTLMGHSSVAMTQRYAHLSADGLRSSARKLDTLSRNAKKAHSK